LPTQKAIGKKKLSYDYWKDKESRADLQLGTWWVITKQSTQEVSKVTQTQHLILRTPVFAPR
jgi:hypothetical protein